MGKESDNSDRLKLTDYIQDLYLGAGYSKNEINWNMIGTQIKNQMKQYNYKHSGIKYCLWYMVEIEQVNLFDENSNGSILNLVPYYYDKARAYWSQTEYVKSQIKDFDFGNELEVVKKSTNNNRIINQINMEDLV